MVEFLWLDYIKAFCGGILMAVAGVLHVWLNGRITGMSGILFGAVTFSQVKTNFSISKKPIDS